MTDRDPAHLHPSVRALQLAHQTAITRRLGIDTTCIETWRAGEGQDEAFEAGLTELRAGGSHHNVCLPDGTPASCAYHLAVDPDGPLLVGFGASALHPRGARTAPVDMGRHGIQDLAPEELLYLAIGLIGEELGLTWGGRWNVRGRGPDWTHFQLAAPLSHILAALKAGRALVA